MKQFEKWKKKNCDDNGCPHEASCNNCEHIWRAAVEWIDNLLEGGDVSWTEGVLSGIQKSIKEELKKEKR